MPGIPQDGTCHQFEQFVGVLALGVQWGEKRTCHIVIAVKAVADGSQIPTVDLFLAHDVQHDATAIAGRVGAIGLNQTIRAFRHIAL
jgi:hypothetical protein